ncbi:mechanosensitive ion channel family protein [Candidatus Nitronereus thalassa]|uniref:Mechanosensitive ion channel n=1 Tax=Candidatus Nitronereus thalassa TaxID=3020898 RepID=A0ABU3K5U1_9BACT|nr:mechanosensitive ion channel domain-containing protein [Candidatus Nitronereus thalassa]MDT7041748.1 mechanosensitive ion channel [Candidatus Nitronereus thalassa]
MGGLQTDLKEWGIVVVTFFESLLKTVGAYLPNLIGAFFLIFIGWAVARILRKLTAKGLRACGIAALGEKIRFNELLQKAGITQSLDAILGGLVYYMVLLVFLVSASEVLGIRVVLQTLNTFIAYFPHILGAFLILMISLYVAKIVKDTIRSTSSNFNIAYAGMLSTLLEIVIVGSGIILALTEIGLDMTVFTANITLIIGGVVLAIALSVGLGSRTIVSNVLSRYYICQIYHIGDEVRLAGQKGTIIKITPISVVLKTENDENLHIPNERIIAEGSRTRNS